MPRSATPFASLFALTTVIALWLPTLLVPAAHTAAIAVMPLA
jgi:hypothetical protein